MCLCVGMMMGVGFEPKVDGLRRGMCQNLEMHMIGTRAEPRMGVCPCIGLNISMCVYACVCVWR